ncbi:MAG TPA: hypothetical protein VFD56_00960 [Chitinophagaceae bacterium]|nr:hypothetical protein [Chitinophagaceae bacterium]
MKKLAAILLIAILSFNWYGYRIVTSILSKNADKKLELRLDNNQYDESQLIELRVSLNLAYQNDQGDFERHYGEIEIDGMYYTYVKRKIEDGYLIVKCIPNRSKEQIKEAGNDYFKMTNGLDQNQPDKKQNSNSNLAKNFWSEYDGRETDFTIDIFSELIRKHFRNSSTALYGICLSSPGQPPETIS